MSTRLRISGVEEQLLISVAEALGLSPSDVASRAIVRVYGKGDLLGVLFGELEELAYGPVGDVLREVHEAIRVARSRGKLEDLVHHIATFELGATATRTPSVHETPG